MGMQAEICAVVIVGCGGAHPIEMYYRITNCPREYEIYAEPTRTIHNAQHFDFVTSTAMSQPGQQKTEYIKDLGPKWRQVGAMVKSAAAGPANLPYAGNPAQNGGEFIFEAGKLPMLPPPSSRDQGRRIARS